MQMTSSCTFGVFLSYSFKFVNQDVLSKQKLDLYLSQIVIELSRDEDKNNALHLNFKVNQFNLMSQLLCTLWTILDSHVYKFSYHSEPYSCCKLVHFLFDSVKNVSEKAFIAVTLTLKSNHSLQILKRVWNRLSPACCVWWQIYWHWFRALLATSILGT